MDLNLKNKIAVVMAASSGIGLGIATALAKEGCSVAICAREPSRLYSAAETLRNNTGMEVLAEVADVSDNYSLNLFLDKVLNTFGKIDILVNNSGGPIPGLTSELVDKDYQTAFDLVLMSKIRTCRKVIPFMTKQGWGRIINIESTSIKCALENMALSNIFRSGSAAFAKTISMEYASSGIRVHTILSGPFLTDRLVELGNVAAQKRGISFEEWKNEAQKGMPLERLGDPLEIGALVAFLASDYADYMTGTTIVIDGGILKTIS